MDLPIKSTLSSISLARTKCDLNYYRSLPLNPKMFTELERTAERTYAAFRTYV